MTEQTLPIPKTKPAGPSTRASSTPWRNRIVGSGEERPDRLLMNPANWRVHPANQNAALAGSLDSVGWVQQVLLNKRTGYVVDGHARVALALTRGEPTVPVLYVELEPEEERVVLATLDPIGAMAEADKAKLAELLRDLTPVDDGLQAMLDDLADKNGLRRHGLTDADELPAEPDAEDIYVQSGELYQLGDHRLLCGDATNPADVLRLLDGAEPTLLSTDPPYGVSLDPTWRDGVYNALGPAERPYMRVDGHADENDATRANVAPRGRTTGHRNTTLSNDTRVDWSEAFDLVPSLKVGYVWHAGVHAAAVADGLTRIGFDIVSQVIWDKGLFAMGRSWYHWAHEPCWVVRKPGAKVPFLGQRNQSTIWRAPSPKMIMGGSKEEKQDHPAQKPVVLSEAPIRNHLHAGESLYDPFLGSGTTLIAAERLGRRCYGMELEPRYAQIIIARWEAFTGRKAVRDG
jgi:DNA modification methylase